MTRKIANGLLHFARKCTKVAASKVQRLADSQTDLDSEKGLADSMCIFDVHRHYRQNHLARQPANAAKEWHDLIGVRALPFGLD